MILLKPFEPQALQAGMVAASAAAGNVAPTSTLSYKGVVLRVSRGGGRVVGRGGPAAEQGRALQSTYQR